MVQSGINDVEGKERVGACALHALLGAMNNQGVALPSAAEFKFSLAVYEGVAHDQTSDLS